MVFGFLTRTSIVLSGVFTTYIMFLLIQNTLCSSNIVEYIAYMYLFSFIYLYNHTNDFDEKCILDFFFKKSYIGTTLINLSKSNFLFYLIILFIILDIMILLKYI
jgi:hypothetical protein